MKSINYWKNKIVGAMLAQDDAAKKLRGVIREIRRDKKRDRKSA